MNLLEVQKKVLRLIEEINTTGTTIENMTDDVDIREKLNDVINQIQFELCRIKKISAKEKMEVVESQELDLCEDLENFYQLNVIKNVRHEQVENYITFLEDGTATIYYYKYPKRITRTTDAEKYKFEITDDVIECLVYGVAADVLKSDVSSNYGKIYADRYNELKQGLDPRLARGNIVICDDGLNF